MQINNDINENITELDSGKEFVTKISSLEPAEDDNTMLKATNDTNEVAIPTSSLEENPNKNNINEPPVDIPTTDNENISNEESTISGTKDDKLVLVDKKHENSEVNEEKISNNSIVTNNKAISNKLAKDDKNLPNKNKDVKYNCFVCFDFESFDLNPILVCHHCNISVHKYCYGVIGHNTESI